MNSITQKETDIIWSKVWNSSKNIDSKNLGGGRLFIEAYPVFKKYFLSGKNLNILDIGSGTGRYGVKIAQDYPDSKTIISDILEESLDVGRKLAEYVDAKNVNFQREDVLKMSFPDDYFDIVFSDALIQHVPNYQSAIEEMKRVLKLGGVMIVSSVNYWNFHSLYKLFLKLRGNEYAYGYEKTFTKYELRKLLINHDLRIVGEDGFYCAYGIYRLKFTLSKFFGILGRVINRVIVRFIDPYTNRLISRNFGFEIFIVGEKNIEKK